MVTKSEQLQTLTLVKPENKNKLQSSDYISTLGPMDQCALDPSNDTRRRNQHQTQVALQ
jgi:hypothetical protein